MTGLTVEQRQIMNERKKLFAQKELLEEQIKSFTQLKKNIDIRLVEIYEEIESWAYQKQ